MAEQDFTLTVSTIEAFSLVKKVRINDVISLSNVVLQKFIANKKYYIEDFVTTNNNIIHEYSSKVKQINAANKGSSFLFNPLRFFNINEPLHSFILAKLLNPNSEHGQGSLFLRLFLFKLGINVSENDKWVVTAEMGRIDILIKRLHPHSVIVIENKSNFAQDQENQLYRYWFTEMFLPNKNKEYRYTLDAKEYYRLIYLTPANHKTPSQNSLMRPDWKWLNNEYPGLPNKLESTDIQIICFNTFIVDWLNECLQNLESNHRLSQFIKQYIELWKT